MKYTAIDNSEIDPVIDQHMKLITDNLTSLLKNDLYAIILTGGFGRGEGSVIIDDDNNVRIINDYDFEIVYKPNFSEFFSKAYMKSRYEKPLALLEEKLAKKINIKQLDFTLKSLNDFKNAHTPRLADYDVKYGHVFLHGDHDPTLKMPQFSPDEIPGFEGSWLLRNRCIGLLLAYHYLSRKDHPTCKATDNFYIEINKAILAMGDALFIINGTYNHSYQTRLDSVSTLADCTFSRIEELIELYKIAAEHKLRPSQKAFDNYKIEELWKKVSSLYIDFFIYHESRRLGTTFESLTSYIMTLPQTPSLGKKGVLRLIYDVIKGKVLLKQVPLMKCTYDKKVNPGFTIALLAVIYDNEKYKPLEKTIRSLAGMEDENCIEICKKYLLLSHPSGELKRFLNKS